MPVITAYAAHAFRIILMRELSSKHLESHPIWSEYYDYDERDEIIQWGVDPVWLDGALSVDIGNEHFAYTILQPYPLPARMRLYIKARFTTAAGRSLDGYVMDEDASVVSIFTGSGQHQFSAHPDLAALNAEEINALRDAAELHDDPIFPMAYETDFLNSEGHLIAGTFDAPR